MFSPIFLFILILWCYKIQLVLVSWECTSSVKFQSRKNWKVWQSIREGRFFTHWLLEMNIIPITFSVHREWRLIFGYCRTLKSRGIKNELGFKSFMSFNSNCFPILKQMCLKTFSSKNPQVCTIPNILKKATVLEVKTGETVL